MKKTIARLLVVITLALMLVPMLYSCNNGMLVDLDGGTVEGIDVMKLTIDEISVIVPEKEGYDFAGWYSDAAFTSYIAPNKVTDAQREYNRAYAKWIVVEQCKEYTVRTDEVQITDAGRDTQHMDKIVLVNDYKVNDLARAGYKKLKMKFSFSICEVDDGNQHVFVYSSRQSATGLNAVSDFSDGYIYGDVAELKKEEEHLKYEHKFEHSPDVLDTEWKTMEFEIELPLSSIGENMYIRYGASGNKNDDWKNKDVIVTVTPMK